MFRRIGPAGQVGPAGDRGFPGMFFVADQLINYNSTIFFL